MNNPWVDLPSAPPYYLPSEKTFINLHNKDAHLDHVIQPELLPEPYLGKPDSPIVLLNLNPGFDEREIPFHRDDHYFINSCKRNLLHLDQAFPFYLLDPRNSNSFGSVWWRKKLRVPMEMAGIERVANRLFCIEYSPYHSKKYKKIKKILASQAYNFYLVNESMKRNAMIIIMRSSKIWDQAIPQLSNYANFYTLKNPQNVTISPGNLTEGYDKFNKLLTY